MFSSAVIYCLSGEAVCLFLHFRRLHSVFSCTNWKRAWTQEDGNTITDDCWVKVTALTFYKVTKERKSHKIIPLCLHHLPCLISSVNTAATAFTELHYTAPNKRFECKSGIKQREMWMGREWGGGGIEAPVFTTSWFLSFPFMSKQRKWDSAAPSSTVVHSWTGLIQCGPDNHHIVYHPRGSALLQRYFSYKHRRSSSPRCPIHYAQDRQQQERENKQKVWMNE